MNFKIALSLLLAVSSVPASAQTAAVQQRFEAATTALNSGDAIGALTAFEVLERDLLAAAKPSPTNIALVRARKAVALLALDRTGEARAQLVLALAGTVLDKPALQEDRDQARLSLASLDELDFDQAAVAEYQTLADTAGQTDLRIAGILGAARSSMFVDAAAALSAFDRSLADLQRGPKLTNEQQSRLQGMRGRVLLNLGRTGEARTVLEHAVALRGGMTLKVDQGDLTLRADAALAMLKLNDVDEARRYLAFTGAGRGKSALPMPVDRPLPDCGDLTGLRPEDTAIIEFAVRLDGQVMGARPVYASRQGSVGYEFARAVAGWSWDPVKLKAIHPFFRESARIELKCTNAGTRRSAIAVADDAFDAWLAQNGVNYEKSDRGAAVTATMFRARMAVGPVGIDRINVLLRLGENATIDQEQRIAYLDEALRLVRASNAPPAAIVRVAASAVAAHERGSYYGRMAKGLASLLEDPVIAADPQARAIVALELAAAYAGDGQMAHRAELVRQTASDPRLSDRDAVKVAALVQLANLEAEAKRLDAAAAAYARTGLSAMQCALIDGGPSLSRFTANSDDYPMEAIRWGFQGWITVEYDVLADGHTRGSRTVMAYPPQIFAKVGEKMGLTARYRVSYRPESDVACVGAKQSVQFIIPS